MTGRVCWYCTGCWRGAPRYRSGRICMWFGTGRVWMKWKNARWVAQLVMYLCSTVCCLVSKFTAASRGFLATTRLSCIYNLSHARYALPMGQIIADELENPVNSPIIRKCSNQWEFVVRRIYENADLRFKHGMKKWRIDGWDDEGCAVAAPLL